MAQGFMACWTALGSLYRTVTVAFCLAVMVYHLLTHYSLYGAALLGSTPVPPQYSQTIVSPRARAPRHSATLRCDLKARSSPISSLSRL
jgi:hypothetical protein